MLAHGLVGAIDRDICRKDKKGRDVGAAGGAANQEQKSKIR